MQCVCVGGGISGGWVVVVVVKIGGTGAGG